MKTVERLIMKAVIIQFLFLLLTQMILHEFDAFPQLKRIIKYEGVTKNAVTKIVETMNNK